MRPKLLLFSPIALILIILSPLLLNAQTEGYNYSVKNRWTVKASYSRYKTAFWDGVHANVGDFFHFEKMRKMANFKMEANYGINKFIEVGVYTGFQQYEWLEDYESSGLESMNESSAPLFGINANFHILPFLVQSRECHWDVYLTTKYGGCYLPHKEIDQPDFDYGKYRQEYGLGLGVGYYFKNIIGIFAEGSLGKFYYFKKFRLGYPTPPYGMVEYVDLTDSNFRFRIGIAAKF